VLTPVTLSVLLVAAGVMVLLDRMGVWHLRAVPFMAVLVGIVGLGLVVGAFVGRARGLIGVGILLTLVTALVAALPGVSSGRVGDARFTPTTVESVPSDGYSWAVGNLTVDLTQLPVSGTQQVAAELGIGNLSVVAPRDVALVIDSHVAAGTTRLPNGERVDGASRDVVRTYPALDSPSRGTLVVRLHVGFGQLEVHRAQA
jgi:hypothetical protein